MIDTKEEIFRRPLWVTLFALTAAVAWGWAYPLIKLGFDEFGITKDMTAGKILFAGIRFMIAGIIVLLIAAFAKRNFAVATKHHGWGYIFLFALLNTTLHYTFFYIGLSHSEGARAAILNSLGVFLLVLLACLFYKSDRLTVRKIIGCVIGFIGILTLNGGTGEYVGFDYLGDGMIILNALCSAFAGIMTRSLGKHVDVFVGTGYSLAFGGLMLLLPAAAMNASLPHVTFSGVIILLFLIVISALGFTLYNKLLTCNPVGKIAIYNSLIPVVGALTSSICLNEKFHWKYMFAAILATIGIYIINKGKG